MARASLSQLRERVQGILAQGLLVSSADELGELAQGLSGLNLSQPAALINQIQQHVADRTVAKKDVEAVIKVLQILSQAEIQVSETSLLNVEKLTQIQGFPSLYVDTGDLVQAKHQNLDDLLRIPNPLVRGSQMVEYVKYASYDALVRSVAIAWFDYALSGAIVAGLQERPEEAFQLAQLALSYPNLVMQSTAISVLERSAGILPAATRLKVLEVLQKELKKSKEPIKYLFIEAIAQIEGKEDEYRQNRQTRVNAHTADIKNLTALKRNDRLKAIKALAKTKDPCFADTLIQALADEDKQVVSAVLDALCKIGGVKAMPAIVGLLTDLNFQYAAAFALYQLGDRRGLEYFLSSKLTNPLQTDATFVEYGLLIVHPLIALIKKVDIPERFREGFDRLLSPFRSQAFALKTLEYINQDPTLTKKFHTLLTCLYPGQSEKIMNTARAQRIAPETPESLHSLILETLGKSPSTFVARLKSNYVIQDLVVMPDGKTLIALDIYGDGTVWQTATWKKGVSFTLKARRWTSHPQEIAVTPDGTHCVTTNRVDNTIDVLKFGDWSHPVASLAHTSDLYATAVTADGAYILGGGVDTVHVWEFGTWKRVASLSGHSNGIPVIKSIPGRGCVVTGDSFGVIQVWDQRTWQKILGWQESGVHQHSVAVSRDGQYLLVIENLAAYLETRVKIWETAAWQQTAYLKISSSAPITCFAFMPDNRYLIAAATGMMKILAIGSWREVMTLPSSDDVRAVAVTPDGKYIVAGQNVWQIDWSCLPEQS